MPEPRVLVDDSQIPESSRIEIVTVLRDYARVRGLRIWASNPHQSTRSPYRGEEYDLRIFFWSLPIQGVSKKLISAYGYTLYGGQGDACAPDDSKVVGTKIYDPASSEVALIVGKTLYVLFDLPHNDGEVPRGDVGKILNLILCDYFLFIDSPQEFVAEMKQRSFEAEKLRFRRHCREAMRVRRLASDEVAVWQTSMDCDKRSFYQELFRWREVLRKGRRGDGQGKKEADSLFQSLCRVSATGNIAVRHHTICIPVGQVDIKDGETWYDIGYFVIFMNLDIKDFSEAVCCHNLTRTVGSGLNHPHVDSDGQMCLGNISDTCERLYEQRELDILTIVLNDFLHSYYRPGQYKDITDWPKKEEV